MSADLLRHVSRLILTNHPKAKIREVANLGDRIMGKALNKLKISHQIGRYLQILLDAPPSVNLTIRKSVQNEFKNEVFRISMHRVKDLDYSLEMYFRAGRSIDPFTDVKDYKYAQKIMAMKEKVDTVSRAEFPDKFQTIKSLESTQKIDK